MSAFDEIFNFVTDESVPPGEVEFRNPPSEKPRGCAFNMDDGTEVPFDVKYLGQDDWLGELVIAAWEPMIEGDYVTILPRVHGMKAELWPYNHILSFSPRFYPEDPQAWADRFLQNSDCLNAARERAEGHAIWHK